MQTAIPVYFLPGTMCDKRLWHSVFEQLADTISPQPIDLPMGDNIEDIVSLLAKQLPEHPIRLVGFSLGGYLAAKFALTYPTRVSQLIVLANSPMSLPPAELSQRKRALAHTIRNGYTGIPLEKIRQLLSPSQADNNDIINLIQTMDHAGGQTKFVSQIQATSSRENLIQPLVDLSVSTTFVYGDEDRLVNHYALDAIDSPTIQKQRLAQCGHMLPLECPEKIALIINNTISVSAD